MNPRVASLFRRDRRWEACLPSCRTGTRVRRERILFASVAAILATVMPATAATLAWDADGVAPVNGGSGLWNTSALTWTPDAGGSYSMWNNGAPDSAIFGGTSGTVTLAEAIVASSLTFNTSSYVIDLNGSDLTQTTTGNAGTGIGSAVITNLAGGTAPTYTHTVGATVPGSSPRMLGNMNVTLSTTTGTWVSLQGGSDFTGVLKLTGGGQFRPDAGPTALGSATGLIQIEAGTQLNFSTTLGLEATYTRNIQLVGDTNRLSSNGVRNIFLTGQISGGALNTVLGQGAIILAGNNTFAGPVNVTTIANSGSALVLAHDNALGSSTAINIGSGDQGTIGLMANPLTGNGITLGSGVNMVLNASNPTSGVGMLHNYSGNNTWAGNITVGSNTGRRMSVEEGSQLTVTGRILQTSASTGPGIFKYGLGTLVLANTNTFGVTNAATLVNATAVYDGILRLDFSQAPGANVVDIVNNGNATNGNQVSSLLLGGGTLELKGKTGETNSQRFKNAATNALTFHAGASAVRAIQNGAASLSMSMGQITARNIGSTVDFTLPSAGVFTLPTGTLPTGGADQIITVNGAAFMTVGGVDWAARDGSNNVAPGSVIGGFYTANTPDTLAGNADMSADGTTTLNTNALLSSLRFNHSGVRTINLNGQMLITGGILVTPGVGGNTSSIVGGTLTAPTATANQDLVLIQNNPADVFLIGAIIADNGTATALTKSGAGTVDLTSPNTYTAQTSVVQGVLKLSHPTALPGGVDSATVAGESNLLLKGGVVGLTGASGPFTRALGTGAGQVQFAGSGGFAAYGGERVVNIGGASATMIWNNAGWNDTNPTPNYVSGGFVPSEASLILGASDATGTIDFQNPIRLLNSSGNLIVLQRMIQVENGSAPVDARISGVINNDGGITKIGAGTLELSALNTYIGPTMVNAGTLLVSGSLAAATSVSVNNGGTLAVGGATGKINGAVTVNTGGTVTGNSTPAGTSLATVTLNGGTIAPGTTVGSLSSGSVFFNTGIFSLEVASDVSFDQLDVNGTVTINAPVTLTLSLASTLPDGALLTILRNDASEAINFTSGAARFVFNGDSLDEGDIFNVTGGFGSQQFQIFYTGDTGNDVVLVAVPEPGTAAAWLAGVGALLGLRRSRRSERANG
jgi:fibronectin-binding autotransporter adhesin